MVTTKFPLITFGYIFGKHFADGASHNVHFVGLSHSFFIGKYSGYTVYGDNLSAMSGMAYGISIYNWVIPE